MQCTSARAWERFSPHRRGRVRVACQFFTCGKVTSSIDFKTKQEEEVMVVKTFVKIMKKLMHIETWEHLKPDVGWCSRSIVALLYSLRSKVDLASCYFCAIATKSLWMTNFSRRRRRWWIGSFSLLGKFCELSILQVVWRVMRTCLMCDRYKF